MDLKKYYKDIRNELERLPAGDVVVVSYQTPDGGKPNVLTETPREVAARMIVNGLARLATPEETEKHRQAKEASYQKALAEQQNKTVRISVLTEADLKALRGEASQKKKE